MVAVAILGIVLSLLIQASVGGMAIEGDAHRRLAASLIADRLLADLESEALLGTPVTIGRNESEEQGYRLLVEIRPFDPARLGLPEPSDPGMAPLTVLLGDGGGTPPPLLEIEISVQWQEGVYTQEVRRTTFSFDAAAAATQLPAEARPDEAGDLE